MDISTFNAILLPLFATWFIPVSIRDRATGKYLGLFNKNVLQLLAILACVETAILLSHYGLSWAALWRLLLYLLMAVVGALVFVKYTQKQLFGNDIKFTQWW